MYVTLAILGGVLGLTITGIAVYSVWLIRQLWQQQAASPRAVSQLEIATDYLSRWTLLDSGTVGIFAIGLLLLLADLLAVLRDKAAYPEYHYGYLLCGIVLSAMGMLLLLVRLFVVIGLARSGHLKRPVAPNHQDEPSHAD